LLTSAIREFRAQFKPPNHSDEKIIDWLIWAYGSLLQDGALLSGQVVYS
jgi:hypothetical protein